MTEKITKTQYNFLKKYEFHNLSTIPIVNNVPQVVFICWFGHAQDSTPAFTVRRYNALLSLVENIKVPVIILTYKNYKSFEVSSSPIHPAFEFLSGNHKSDYLRAYLLYHYGGGYHDIKYREKSWENEWEKFSNPNIWLIGRREYKEECIGKTDNNSDIQKHFNKLITLSWIISTPKNKFFENLLNYQHNILDAKYDLLKNNPAYCPRLTEQNQENNPDYKYPLRYLELMGEYSHPLQLGFLDHIEYSLPDILYKTYK